MSILGRRAIRTCGQRHVRANLVEAGGCKTQQQTSIRGRELKLQNVHSRCVLQVIEPMIGRMKL
jgi:hypothetical protein